MEQSVSLGSAMAASSVSAMNQLEEQDQHFNLPRSELLVSSSSDAGNVRSRSSRSRPRSWPFLMGLTTLAAVLVGSTVVALPTVSAASQEASSSSTIPFLQTLPPRDKLTTQQQQKKKPFSTYNLLGAFEDLKTKLKSDQSYPPPPTAQKTRATTANMRGNVRRRNRARSNKINRAHRSLRNHNHRTHQKHPAAHHRAGHNAAMEEKGSGDEHPRQTHDHDTSADEAYYEGIIADDVDWSYVHGYNETEHGDGLDHHHHKHSHHKQQHNKHHQKTKGGLPSHSNPHDGRHAHHKESKAKLSKGTGYKGYSAAYETTDYYEGGDKHHKHKGDGPDYYADPEAAMEYGELEYAHAYNSKSKTTKSKSKSAKVVRGKRGKSKSKGTSSSSYGELRYFEASILLEMQDHYISELSYLDLRQLQTAVVETYNHLAVYNCDLQSRELIAATSDPTPTSTGYVLHLQGQCYDCDPATVHVFAHEDQIFDQDMITMGEMDSQDDQAALSEDDHSMGSMDMGDFTMPPVGVTGESTDETPAGGSNVTEGGAGGTMPTEGGMDSMGNTTMDAPAAGDMGAGADGGGNMTENAPPPGMMDAMGGGDNTTATGRNRGGVLNQYASGYNYNYNNHQGRFPTSDGTTFVGGQSVTGFASDHAGMQPEKFLLPKKHKTFSKKGTRLVRSEDEAEAEEQTLADAEPNFSYGVTAESQASYFHNDQVRGRRGTRRQLHQHHQQHTHNHHHHVPDHVSVSDNPDAMNRDPQVGTAGHQEELMEEDRHMHYNAMDNGGLIMPYSSKKSKVARRGKSKGASSGYHPERHCSNPEATKRAPTEEQFVVALNEVTNELLAQYNKLLVRSAVQVQTEPCSAIEEHFDSAIIVQFGGPEGANPADLTPQEIEVMEQTILHSYNHLQATHSCDVPHFREMTQLTLVGIAPGPDGTDTFLAMFEVQGTCRGDGCSEEATFLDPRNARTRQLDGHAYMPSGGFNTVISGQDGHPVAYSEEDHHVYQEQCYCPFMVDEYGPPFVSDIITVLNQILSDAHHAGMTDHAASVEAIVEVSDEDRVDYDETPSPRSQEKVESFVMVQFFGMRDLVSEREVREIEQALPMIYQALQDNAYCDPLGREIVSAELRTVDPGPTEDSFLLGFALEGTCEGDSCRDFQVFFASADQQFVSCGVNKVEGAPIIQDFENELFNAILMMRSSGDLMHIQASGDAVEVPPGGAPPPPPPPPVSDMNMNMEEGTMAPVPAPVASGITGRNAQPTENKQARASSHPTYWPTWLDTDYPTYRPV